MCLRGKAGKKQGQERYMFKGEHGFEEWVLITILSQLKRLDYLKSVNIKC